jgi:integrative and conjugative element protein (TIGR02256 family)
VTLKYSLGSSRQNLILGNAPVNYMKRNQQRRWWQREAGGQLFARFHDGHLMVEEATGPRSSDRRTRVSYIPYSVAEQREIDERFELGLHYVGDWHTHPEEYPVPSARDFASIRNCFMKSRHDLNAFLLVIVGLAPLPAGLHVSLHDGNAPIILQGTCNW